MQSYFNCDTPSEAWRKIIRPGETVGLKVNCLSGKGGSTSVSLTDAICERLQQAGVKQQNIIIWDRLNEDLESAGFRITSRSGRLRYMGNDVPGYESELSVYGSVGSLLSKTLTQLCDAVINLPVLKDHGIVGVTMALKNMFGATTPTSTTPTQAIRTRLSLGGDFGFLHRNPRLSGGQRRMFGDN
jgi:uncharacterized protein (DUF362 family)